MASPPSQDRRANPGSAACAPVLLDVTRLVALAWSGRQPTGIDRVCSAYLRHFLDRARAVVQYRGLIRVLDERASADLFGLLEQPRNAVRAGLVRLLSRALVMGPSPHGAWEGAAYLNPGHTDFDLPAHHLWTRQSGIRPFYLVHDLIPVLHPDFSRPHAVSRHLGRVRGALEHAAGIIVTSHAVSRELEAFAAAQGLPLPPLAVAPIAGADFGDTAPPFPAATPFFLVLGTIEPRKNHRLLFEVWQRLVRRYGEATPRLIIAGQTGPLTGDILAPLTSPDLRGTIEHRPTCSDSEIARLLHHAAALLVPSLAEGFGLPVVEALQAGTPVIASDLPVFREIGQGHAQLIAPDDHAGWEQAITGAVAHSETARHAVTGFRPPRWDAHFAVVDQFAAAPSGTRQSPSERVLAA
jgi:glycosyltransferase involved in cell wall biosynthesis